ncbi:type II toxin-antitoxin system VapC family toxin [Cyanobacteria bacterium FACHB-63]|nr:type II toxin-antitoxin system VapC family toxin [Cyanobacteria bacterium FACHB-63]
MVPSSSFHRFLKMIFEMLDFDDGASQAFAEINPGQLRLGVMDARIAAIVISHNLVLLTRNLRDFDKVPHTRQDWTIGVS